MPLTSDGKSFRLRSQLCEYLVDMPGLLARSSKFLGFTTRTHHRSAIFQTQATSLRCETANLKASFLAWYAGEVQPVLFEDVSSESSLIMRGPTFGEPARKYAGPGLLFPILDCVSNSVLMTLDRILLRLLNLDERHCGEVGSITDDFVIRKANANAALAYVKMKSTICAKPLELGLRELRVHNGNELVSRAPTVSDDARGPSVVPPLDGTVGASNTGRERPLS